MAKNYSIVDIAGRSQVKVAVVDHDMPERGVKSPEWMIRLDDIVYSYVKGYESYCELFGWHSESNRFTNPDISNELFTSATLYHSDVILIIPNGGYSTVLQNRMNSGQIIEEMEIVRLGNVGKIKVKLQEIIHKICRLQSVQQQLDQLVLSFQVTSKMDTHFIYDVTGQIKGQMVSSVNYSLGSINNGDDEEDY